jgi:hypothetical protein
MIIFLQNWNEETLDSIFVSIQKKIQCRIISLKVVTRLIEVNITCGSSPMYRNPRPAYEYYSPKLKWPPPIPKKFNFILLFTRTCNKSFFLNHRNMSTASFISEDNKSTNVKIKNISICTANDNSFIHTKKKIIDADSKIYTNIGTWTYVVLE